MPPTILLPLSEAHPTNRNNKRKIIIFKELILTANLSIDIKNIDRLYSFLNTNKRLRKDIKNIKLNIIYDFLSNQIKFNNIRINDNDVNSQFNNIAEGFIDINSNNLTKSRKLLNELINLYAG